MDELKQLATWVREQHAEEYILTWLLTQPGLWWSDGEVYQAALAKASDRLKIYVQKSDRNEILKGIAENLSQEESWEVVAASLSRIFEVYQEELAKLQDYRRKLEITTKPTENNNRLIANNTQVQVSTIKGDISGDPLTGQ